MKRFVVTVFGSSDPKPNSPAYQTAYQLGRAIAAEGWTLCNGGYGGTMEAGAKGATEAGGDTIGVTCTAFGRGGPNAYVREEVATSNLLERLDALVRLGSAFVVLPGGTGTLVELGLVWELLNKGLLRRRGPLILLGTHWLSVVEAVRAVQPEANRLEVAEGISEVVALLRRFLPGHVNDESSSATA